VEANEKSKKVLLGLASGADNSLLSTIFISWSEYFKRQKKETEIREEYEHEIEVAEKRLADYIEKQVGAIKNMLMKKFAVGEAMLVETCFVALVDEVKLQKQSKEDAIQAKELEEKLKNFTSAQAAKSKKVLSRMNAGSDAGLVHMMWTAWIQFCEDYKKDREINDAAKAAEMKLNEFMQKRGESAKGVITRMTNASDSGLITTAMEGWIEVFKEEKQANEMKNLLASQTGKFESFGLRNKQSAGSCMERATQVADLGWYITIFYYWLREARVERMRRYAKERNYKKKQQLAGVKGLFRNFAGELEAGLKDGTPRVDQAPAASVLSPAAKTQQSDPPGKPVFG